MAKDRSAREIIDDALRENMKWEWLAYSGIVLCLVIGLTALIIGLLRWDTATSVTGGVVTTLFWPGLRFADKFRRHNIRIRLSEMAISKAKTADEAIRLLVEFLQV